MDRTAIHVDKVLRVPSSYEQWRIKSLMQLYGMVSMPYTRRRLACHRLPTLGRWERREHISPILHWEALQAYQRWLPPECIAPGGAKLRSHRADASINTLVYAAEPSSNGRWVSWTELQAVLDLPKDEIDTLVRMHALRKLGAK